MITLVGGGVRSGKSAHALGLALAAGPKRTFIATAQAFDAEMTERIAAHQQERGQQFTTLEAPLELAQALERCRGQDSVLVDCITLWLSNQLLQELTSAAILERVDRVIHLARELGPQVIFVTNEVGMGIVPDSKLGRLFRDLAGHTNQRLAAAADQVHFAAMGLMLQLRPAPLCVLPPLQP